MAKDGKGKNLITIIVVTYKSSHLIQKTLANIIKQDFRIIIVDNGSNDDIEEVLAENIKNNEVEFIAFENNCGFGRANNFALEKTDSEYAFILNPDCFIDADSINNIAYEMDKDQNIALANPCFVGKDHQKDKSIGGVTNISFVCGGAMMMRMEIFNKIGFFDKNLFLYCEDGEISQRVIDLGYKSISVNKALCFHQGGKSSDENRYLEKIYLHFLRSWHRGWSQAYFFKKRKFGRAKLLVKNIYRIGSIAVHLLLILKKNIFLRIVIKVAFMLGSVSNLLGIDCFNKNNKEIRLKNLQK